MTDNATVLAERAEIDAIVEGKTIVDSFNRNAAQYPNEPAIHWKDGDWQSLTWAEYRDVSGGILMKAVGLGADQVHGTMDNTEAYRVMYSVLFGPLPG